jgi:UDP-GlcNAc3NAcA epimerase
MKRVLTVVGARPQFIKAAVVSRLLRRHPRLAEDLVHTGQHYDDRMSHVFFEELEIPEPRVNLGIGSGPHGAQTGRMLEAIESTLDSLRPALVLVYGDTNSTLAAALAAAKMAIPVAHVEAGLRSFARTMPEEVNRIVADHLAALLFPPTEAAERRLREEGLGDRQIEQAGDVMYDACLHATAHARAGRSVLSDLGVAPGGYLLATVHRAENTDRPHRLAAIVAALAELAHVRPVVWPLHPRTRAALGGTLPAGVQVIEPVGYFDMQVLEAGAGLIVTDSGGVQKEAYWHRVPCVTLRDETEWVELLATGWNRLAPPEQADTIVAAAEAALAAPAGPSPALYGDGRAGERIVAALDRFLG